MKRTVLFCLLFLGAVVSPVLALFLTEPLLLAVAIGCFIGIIVFLYSMDPKGVEEDIARRTKVQQDYDNEYGVTSYFGRDKAYGEREETQRKNR